MKYKLELLEGPTDNPIKITKIKNGKSKILLIESIPWQIIGMRPWRHRHMISEDILDFCFNYKDNPVPSLDNLLDWMELNKDYSKKTEKQKTIMLDSLYLMINKLQNGVETDKEEPKLKKYELIHQNNDEIILRKIGS